MKITRFYPVIVLTQLVLVDVLLNLVQWSAAVGAAAAADGRRCVRRHDGDRCRCWDARARSAAERIECPTGNVTVPARAHSHCARGIGCLCAKPERGAQSGERAMRGVPCANVCAAESFAQMCLLRACCVCLWRAFRRVASAKPNGNGDGIYRMPTSPLHHVRPPIPPHCTSTVIFPTCSFRGAGSNNINDNRAGAYTNLCVRARCM